MDDLINQIFRVSVKPPCTYDLRFDHTNPDNSDKNINDILIMVFVKGMQILFGGTVNPTNIQKDQFDEVNSYIHSIGYNTIMKGVYDSDNNPTNVEILFEKLNVDVEE